MSKTIDSEEIRREMLAFLSRSQDSSQLHISANDSLKDAGIDSFRIIELILFMENRFKLRFPEENYTAANLKSVDSILHCVLQQENS